MLSTNIAETSLTIDGIVYVVDIGLSKQKFYDPKTRLESLLVYLVSQATANQRTGRAGRTQPGKCFRLYTEKIFSSELLPQTIPEILRSNLVNAVLTLKNIGINDLEKFDFMDTPNSETLLRASETLLYLGAVDVEGKLTKLGRLMNKFPLDPHMSEVLVVSPKFNCSSAILSIAAMLSGADCFVRRRGSKKAAEEVKAQFRHADEGYSMWCYENFVNERAMETADKVREQLSNIMIRHKLKLSKSDQNSSDYIINIKKALLSGYFMQVAYLKQDGNYSTMDNQIACLYPSNTLYHEPK